MKKGVLFAAAEGLPFIKSGGLADVIGSLPYYLDKEQFKVGVVLPMYKKIIIENPQIEQIADFDVHSGLINKKASLYHTVINDVDFYFIREDSYFYREQMYGYVDDGERFAFYDKAVLEMLPHMGFKVDIIHSHDWHTGMIPVLCKKEYKTKAYTNIKHVFTIHNLAFQGNYPKEMLRYFNLDDKYFKNGDIKFDDGISFMKAAIQFADKVTTVSNSYAGEILSSEFGEKMEGPLNYRKEDLWGIVNGIDTNMWNPETDGNILANYSLKNMSGKKACKKDLQRQLGLRVADDVMLIGVVSRLTHQKGISLLMDRLSVIMGQDVQLVILGTGDSYTENFFKKIEYDYPHRAVYYCGYNEALSHAIYAGIDMLLMPSLFEPCGISQLIAMRYGTLPLVREVGGLKDTVAPYNEFNKSGTGFTFKNFNSDDMIYILKYAIEVYYYRQKDWKAMMKQAMKKDVSWDCSAKLYKQLYNSL